MSMGQYEDDDLYICEECRAKIYPGQILYINRHNEAYCENCLKRLKDDLPLEEFMEIFGAEFETATR